MSQTQPIDPISGRSKRREHQLRTKGSILTNDVEPILQGYLEIVEYR